MRALRSRLLSALQPEAPAPEVQEVKEYVVHLSPGLESFWSEQIQSQLPESICLRTVSLETQQIDEEARLQQLRAEYEDLLQLTNPSQHTGDVQIFLLDEAGMAVGHAGSNAALRAAVTASLRDPSRVVAALTSSWKEPPTSASSTTAVQRKRGVLRNYLLAAGVTTVESLDELKSALERF